MTYKIWYENTSPYDEKRLLQFALYIQQTIEKEEAQIFFMNNILREFYYFSEELWFENDILKDLIRKIFNVFIKIDNIDYFETYSLELFYLVSKFDIEDLFDEVIFLLLTEDIFPCISKIDFCEFHIKNTPLSHFLLWLKIESLNNVLTKIKNFNIWPLARYAIIFVLEFNYKYWATIPTYVKITNHENELMWAMIYSAYQNKNLLILDTILSFVIHFLPDKKDYVLWKMLEYKDISSYILASYYKNHLVINGDNTYYIKKLTELAQDKIHGLHAQDVLIEYDYNTEYDKDKYVSQILSKSILEHFWEYPSDINQVDKRRLKLFKTNDDETEVYIFRYKIRAQWYINYWLIIDTEPYLTESNLLDLSYYEIYNVAMSYYVKEYQDYKNDYSLLQENIISKGTCKFLNAFSFFRISDIGNALLAIWIWIFFVLNFILWLGLFIHDNDLDRFNLVYLIISWFSLIWFTAFLKYSLKLTTVLFFLFFVICLQLLLANIIILWFVLFGNLVLFTIWSLTLYVVKKEYIFLRYVYELKKVFKNESIDINYNKTFTPQSQWKPLFQIEFNKFEKIIIADIFQHKYLISSLQEYEDKILSSLNLSYWLFLLYEKCLWEKWFLKKYIILWNKILHHPKTPDCIKSIIKNKLNFIEEFNKERKE